LVLDYLTGISSKESNRILVYPNPATKTVVNISESKGTVRFIIPDRKII